MTKQRKLNPATGIATLTIDGTPIVSITHCEDGTFGWRSHGKIKTVGRDGEEKSGYKFKKGFDDMQKAIAHSLVFLQNSWAFEVDHSKLKIVAYDAPERSASFGKKLEEREEFQEAMKLAKGLRIPAAVKKDMKDVVGE